MTSVSALRRSDRLSGRSLRCRRARRVAVAAAFACCVIAAAACSPEPTGPPPPSPGAIPAGQSIGTSAIDGHARFEGAPPPRRPIRMSSEASCQRSGVEPLSEDVIVSSDGALKNVYVHVVSGLGDRVFAPPSSPAVMDQAVCAFVPHVDIDRKSVV